MALPTAEQYSTLRALFQRVNQLVYILELNLMDGSDIYEEAREVHEQLDKIMRGGEAAFASTLTDYQTAQFEIEDAEDSVGSIEAALRFNANQVADDLQFHVTKALENPDYSSEYKSSLEDRFNMLKAVQGDESFEQFAVKRSIVDRLLGEPELKSESDQ